MCGNPRERCHDETVDWYPMRDVCYATMAKVAAERMYARLHEESPYHDGSFRSWAKEPSRSHPFHAGDGVTIWVAELDAHPHDNFTTDAYASPAAEGGESDRD